MSDDNLNIVFISGTGRSGTNLTKKICTKHQNVATLPFEHRFTIDPFGLIDTYSNLKNNWSPYIVEAKVSMMEKFLSAIKNKSIVRSLIGNLLKCLRLPGTFVTPPSYFEWEMEKWFPNYSKHVENLIDDLVDFRYTGYWPGEKALKINNQMKFVSFNKDIEKPFRNFFRAVIRDLLDKEKKTCFVEDNTWNLLFAEDIKQIIPEAKFLHVVRDPRDVVVSLSKQRWAPSNLKKCIMYYSSLMDNILSSSLEANSIYEFKLEELIITPKRICTNMCNFCGLTFEENMLNIDLSHSHTGRWKRELNPKEKEIINNSLKKYIRHFNYK